MLTLFPEQRPVYPEKPSEGLYAVVKLSRGKTFATATTLLHAGGECYRGTARCKEALLRGEVETDRYCQRILKQSFYRAGIQYLGKKPAWGALGGIRPAKLMGRILDEGVSDAAAKTKFIELYDATPERTRLCLDAAKKAKKVEKTLENRDVCLYVGVPFCPTRCAYCSFVSQAVEKSMALMEPYVEALCRDIRATAEKVRQAKLRPISIYFGGGTPTTLSAEQLETVSCELERNFDLADCREITVEAGRPDTITEEKLRVLRAHNVSRVSVNPQTMRDAVLNAIGRRHTAADVLSALEKVRAVGGFEVNMDLIAGLPEDSVAGFAETLETVLSLGVENITVHTLSLKKGSRITLEGTRLPGEAEVGEMLDLAEKKLRAAGYAPYYLYRQKFMSGGFENVGWCRPGTDNLYNICIMEELCGILSMGAGASTKMVRSGGYLERFFAPKYPLEYINTIEKICNDKSKIVDFYKEAEL